MLQHLKEQFNVDFSEMLDAIALAKLAVQYVRDDYFDYI